jgi:hypothetical protein
MDTAQNLGLNFMPIARPAPPSCHCREPMELVRYITHVEGVPEIFVFYCTRCKHAETKVREPGAAAGRHIGTYESEIRGMQSIPI